MDNPDLLEALKKGLKGELDSVTVYTEAATRATGEVAAFFKERAEEEKRHYNWLLTYYKETLQGKVPHYNIASDVYAMDQKSEIMTPQFLKRLGENQHLVTAISTATLLEFTAMGFYRAAADGAPNEALRDFFLKLSAWEEGHYNEFLRLQDETAQYWFDVQRFEPF
jgi:rubrerythrin